MSKYSQAINLDYNFWEMYPELKNIEEFKFLQKEYKSKSSDIMWFIVAVFDTDSIFFQLDIDVKTELLSKDYLKDKTWYKLNIKKITNSIDKFIEVVDTAGSRHLRQWVETVNKRTKFLKETEYDLDNYDKLDRMAVGTAKIFDTFKTIQEQLSKEKGSGATKGGHELSLLDQEDL
jgi:hypothetical protein